MSGNVPSAAMAAARALAPLIHGFAEEIERSRRLPLPLVDAMAQAGLFHLWVPRALDGEEADPMTLVGVVEEISRADGSVGWCVAIGGGSGVFGGYLPSASAGEIYGGDPNVRMAGSFRPFGEAMVVDGGYRVTGRWPLGSGCQHSPWIVGSCRILDGADRACRQTAHLSRVSCCSRLRTAKSLTPGTALGCAGLAAMTLPSRMFLFRPIAHFRSGNHLWSQGRFMRCLR